MPACVEKGQKQLTTLQANQSRMITKCCWVIEVINSFLKTSFRALDKLRNKCLPTELQHPLLIDFSSVFTQTRMTNEK